MFAARRASQADLRLVQAITKAAYAEYLPLLDAPPLPLTEDYAPRIGAGEVWLVARDGVDVGLCVLEHAPDHLMIFSLAVMPEARGGVGRWMLGFAEDQARGAGLPEVRLYTNGRMKRNIRVYGEAGYLETGRLMNPKRPGWIAVHMAKRV